MLNGQCAEWIAAALLATAALPAACRGEDVLWVSELAVDSKLLGKEVIVEGRFQGRVGANLDQLRLKNVNPDQCEIRLQPEAERRFPSNMQFIRLAGTLSLSGDKLMFRVHTWWKINTTDEERFQEVSDRLGVADVRGWYGLAERTRRLARLHGDEQLMQLSEQARVKGFRAEESALTPEQFETLYQLADRASEVGLDAEESRRMRHKALRWQFDRISRTAGSAETWSSFADRIARLLPGAKVPLKSNDSAILAQYRKQPIELYESAPQSREVFDREFWITIASRSVVAAAEQPDAELVQLASDTRRLIPERPELSRQVLRQWADFEASRIPSLPPASQVRRLAEVYRSQLGDAVQARSVLRQWLDSRRKSLSPRDADGRVRLAKDLRSDLNDDDGAAKLLLEAVQIENDLPDAIEALKSLGYALGPNGWTRVADRATGAAEPPAHRRRLPELGMSTAQVRQILGDPRPTSTIRYTDVGSDRRRVFVERWTYHGPPDVHVVFQLDKGGEAKVIGINTQSQQ